MCEIGFLCLHVEYGQLLVDSLENISNFLIEGPGKKRKKKKEKFPRLAKAFLLRVAESNRNFYIFLHEVPPAATPPRELQ